MNNSRKITAYLLAIVTVLAVVLFCSLFFSSTIYFKNENANIVNTAYTSVDYEANGAGHDDGWVSDNYNHGLANATAFAGGENKLSGSTNYYLTENKTVTGDFVEDTNITEFSGIFDGCGKTVYVNIVHNKPSDEMANGHNFGGLATILNGAKIKNVTFVINASYTRKIKAVDVNVGAIAHDVKNTTFENVKFVVNTDKFVHINKNRWYFANVRTGLIAGTQSGNLTLKNVTFDLQKDYLVHFQHDSGEVEFNQGLVVGRVVGTQNLYMYNCTITGSKSVKQTTSNASKVRTMSGAFVGWCEGNTALSINGLEAGGWTGEVSQQATYNSSKDNKRGRISGSGVYSTIENIFVKTGSYLATANASPLYNGAYNNTYQDKLKFYSIDPSLIGFCKPTGNAVSSNIWLGFLSSYTPNNINTTGGYVRSFKINGEEQDCSAKVANDGITQNTIPVYAISNIPYSETAVISDIKEGYYAYIEHKHNFNCSTHNLEQKGQGETATLEDKTTYKTTYNATNLENLSSTFKVYREGATSFNTTSYSWSYNNNGNSDVRQAGEYIMTASPEIKSEFITYNNNQYYAVKNTTDGYYNLKIEINEATDVQWSNIGVANELGSPNALTFSPSNTSTTYTISRVYDDYYIYILPTLEIKVSNKDGTGYNSIPDEDIDITVSHNETTTTNQANLAGVEEYTSPDGKNGFKIKRVKVNSSNAPTNYVFTYTLTTGNFTKGPITCNITITKADVNIGAVQYKNIEYNGLPQSVGVNNYGLPNSASIRYYTFNESPASLIGGTILDNLPSEVGNYRIEVDAFEDESNPDYRIVAGASLFSIYPREIAITNLNREYFRTQNDIARDKAIVIGENNLKIYFDRLCENHTLSDINFTSGKTVATFADKDVDAQKAVTFSSELFESYSTSLPTGGTNSVAAITKTYRLKGTNYAFSSDTFNCGVVYPKAVSLDKAYKEYDGNNILNASEDTIVFNGLMYTDTTGLTGEIGTYNSKDVGLNKTVTFTSGINNWSYSDGTNSVTLSRLGSSNYCLSQNDAQRGYIYPKAIDITSVSKVFDNNTTIHSSKVTYSGVYNNELNSLSTDVGNYDNVNCGSGKTITYTYVETFNATAVSFTTNYRIRGTNYCLRQNTYNVGVITPASIKLKFNDVKMLYDSIMDYNSNTKTYDFIYVAGSKYAQKYLNSDVFEKTYSKYLNSFVTVDNQVVSGQIVAKLESTNYTATGNRKIILDWELNASSDYVNNYSLDTLIDGIPVITTGAGYNELNSSGYYATGNYCESVYTGNERKVRVIVVSENNQNGSWSENSVVDDYGVAITSSNLPPLYQFINSHYYDTNTYAQKTTYTLTSDKYNFNRLFTASRILPAYKTIRGTTQTGGDSTIIYYKTFGGTDSNQVAEHIFEPGGSSEPSTANHTAVTGTSGRSNNLKEFPAYINYGGEKYNGAGSFIALNYGTIENIVFDFWYKEKNSQGCKMHIKGLDTQTNTSLGLVVGINAGLITDTKIMPRRQWVLEAQSGSNKNTSIGLITGLNLGDIENTSLQIAARVTEGGTYNTYVEVRGTAKNVLYGVAAGINESDCKISGITYTNRIKTTINVTGKLYAGGFVGYNEGILSNLKYNNYRATSFAGQEISYKATGDLMMGGIAGCNDNGRIENCDFINGATGETNTQFKALPKDSGGNRIFMGGITAWNKGNQDWQTGLINNCSVVNNGVMFGGDQRFLDGGYTDPDALISMLAFSMGGIAGVSSGGKINECNMENRHQMLIHTATKMTNNQGYFLGVLIGAACEEKTCVQIAINGIQTYGRTDIFNTAILAGQLTNCRSFNLSGADGLGSRWGYFGYVAGTYNTILFGGNKYGLTNSSLGINYDYAHEYGNIIWYTSTVTAGYEKCVFGSIASVLGHNPGLGDGSDNVYITGIAGVGLVDLGDQTVARAMLQSINIIKQADSDDKIRIEYNAPPEGHYTAMEAFFYTKDGNKQTLLNKTTNMTEGSFEIDTSLANAIIYSTKTAAASVDIIVFLYANIPTKAALYSFIGDQAVAGTYDAYLYCAGQGDVTQDISVAQAGYNGTTAVGMNGSVLKKYKVLNGNNHSITYTYGNNNESQPTKELEIRNSHNEAKKVHAAGELVAVNEGTIKNLTINLTIANSTKTYMTANANKENSIMAIGLICGVNSGEIENCSVNINNMYGVELKSNVQNRIVALGGAVGLNNGGKINGLSVVLSEALAIYGEQSISGSNPYATAGGAVGIAFGGTYSNIKVSGSGYVHSYYGGEGSPNNLYNALYLGGVFGCMPLIDTFAFGGYKLTAVESLSGIKALLKGYGTKVVYSEDRINVGTGYVAGGVVNNINDAESSIVSNKINGNVTVLSYGDVDVFQTRGLYENSIYGYVSDYTKDYTKTRSREEYAILRGTNRIILQDGSYIGLGIKEQLKTGTVEIVSDVQLKVTIAWDSAATNRNISSGNKINTSATVAVSGNVVTINNLTASNNTRGFKVVVNYGYDMAISEEDWTTSWSSTSAMVNSPYVNFISGRGNHPLYAGATKGNLQGDIKFNKPILAAIELSERKTLNGNNHTIQSMWQGPANEGCQILGFSDTNGGSNGGQTPGANLISNKYEYNLWYQATSGNTSINYYGVSDCISINRGTIENLKFTTLGADVKHNYNGLIGEGANTAYGSLCGVNLGTIRGCEAKVVVNSTFTAQESTAELLASPGVGLNNGIMENCTIELNASYTFAGVANSLIMGGATAVNAFDGQLLTVTVIINGNLVRQCQATTTDASGVAFGGIAGINDGGVINYVTLEGNAKIEATSVTDEEFTRVEEVPVLDEHGNPVYSTSADGTQVQMVETINWYKDDANYLYFALGVAISNNEVGKYVNYLGHSIAPCVVERSDSPGNYANKVSNMLLKFKGEVVFHTANKYMTGLAFAKASDTTISEANKSPAYQGIFVDSHFSSYAELYTLAGYNEKGKYRGLVTGAGMSLMGHVTENRFGSDFVIGGRIDANADIEVEWGKTNGNLNGHLAVSSTNKTMSGLDAVYKMQMPDGTILDPQISLNSNDGYISYTAPDKVTLYRKLLDEMYNNAGALTQIEIEYHFPYTHIYDIFQLKQFMQFDAEDSVETYKTNYLIKYASEIAKLIDKNQKQATASNPYGAWCKAADKDAIAAKTENGVAIYQDTDFVPYPIGATGDAITHYLIVEKYKNSDNEIVPYYAAYLGELQNDLVLDQYSYGTNGLIEIKIGWEAVVTYEMAETKRFEGNGHEVTIVAKEMASYDWNTVALSDIAATPAIDLNPYCFGGFAGIVRGTINNVNFKFRENTQLNICDGNLATARVMKASAFIGLVAGYLTGSIDSCTLEMEDNTQLYLYKYKGTGGADIANQNHSKWNTNTVAAFVGLTGKGARISNCVLTMGENSIVAVNSKGTNNFGVQQSIFNYVGGFTGMMLDNSILYNLKIEGAASSLLASVGCTDCNGRFNCFYSGTGGVVGCNSANAEWNPHGLGRGTIDGVIFNWKGACLNVVWYSQGWFGSNVGGSRNKMTTTYFGGAALGVADENTASNFYYTFDISSFAKDLTKDFIRGVQQDSGVYIHGQSNGATNTSYIDAKTLGADTDRKYFPSTTYYKKEGSTYKKVPELTEADFNNGTYYTTRAFKLVINRSGEFVFDTTNKYAICLSDILMQGQTALKPKTLRVFELTETSRQGTSLGNGIYNITPEINNNAEIYRGVHKKTAENPAGVLDPQGYTELLTLGDALNWADKTRGSDILCKFTADADDPASVMWAIDIYRATNVGNKLWGAENTLTEIPVYKFAESIEDAQSYKQISYTISRGEGDGMELYFCTGNAATISPDKAHYTNKKDINTPNIYYPLHAIMFDGLTDATKLSVDIYDQNGDEINRIKNYVTNILTTAKDVEKKIKTNIQVHNGSSYVNTQEQTKLTDIGSYRIVYNIYSNGLNNNAYVSTTYRTQFFSSDGSPAIQEVSGEYLVETYVIYIVIAPITIKFTDIWKKYDGTTHLNYEDTTQNPAVYNYSMLNLQIKNPFTYSATGAASVTYSDNRIRLSTNSNTRSMLEGSYDQADVDEKRTMTLNLATGDKGYIDYILYEYNADLNRYIEKRIRQICLKNVDNESRSFFAIYEMSKDATIDDAGNKIYGGYGSADISTYYVLSQDLGNCASVKIVKDDPLRIETNFTNQQVEYTGSEIVLNAQDLQSNITVYDTFGRNVTANVLEQLSITINGDAIKNVQEGGYSRSVTIQYTGNNYLSQDKFADLTIFVTPAKLQIQKVIKQYDNDPTLSTATRYKISGLKGSDAQTGLELGGSYIDVNVGKDKPVTINTTNITINSVSYKTIKHNTYPNYYIESDSISVGVITPVAGIIKNAYKTYDGTNTLAPANILITDSSDAQLNFILQNPTFSSAQVGQNDVLVTLGVFTYQDENDVEQTHYMLTDNGNMTNYEIEGAGTSYTAQGVGYIIPKAITINGVYKEYDGNTNLGEFDMSGLLEASPAAFDGKYSASTVKYTGTSYNDVLLDAEEFSYQKNENGALISETIYRLKSGGNATNYTVVATMQGAQFKIIGKGIIAPKEAQITRVTKQYDNSSYFNTATSSTTTATIKLGVNGATTTSYNVSGTMSGSEATNGGTTRPLHTVYVESYDNFTFTFKGTTYNYYWLYNPGTNAKYNYRIASTSIAGIGDIIRKVITLSTGSSGGDGTLYNLRFENVNSNAFSGGIVRISNQDKPTYLQGQSYSISNFKATLMWGGVQKELNNGQMQVDGETITFTLNPTSVSNAGTHTFTLSMQSKNFEVQSNNAQFDLTIQKRTIAASAITLSVNNLEKEYDGTSNGPSENITINSAKANVPTTSGNELIDISYMSSIGSILFDETWKNADTYTGLTTNVAISDTNYEGGGDVTLSNSYTIRKKEIKLNSQIEKEFDGSNKLKIAGVDGETIIATYTVSENLNTLPGLYTTNSATIQPNKVEVDLETPDVNSSSGPQNYEIKVEQGFKLNIGKAKLVAERSYLTNNTFIVNTMLAKLTGLEFLTQANETLTPDKISDFIANQAVNLSAVKTALATLFVFKYNESIGWDTISADDINSVKLISETIEENTIYALEFSVVKQELDNVTLTDRYAVYMKDKTFGETASGSDITYGSNIAESSSELAEGQFNGTYNTGNTGNIQSAQQLREFLDGTNSNGYLTNNIHNFDASLLTTKTFAQSRVLDGNGYTITIVGDVCKEGTENATLGFFMAINAGTIKNINFVFMSNKTIKDKNSKLGLIVGENSGTIENCSLKILNSPVLKKEKIENVDRDIPVTIAGYAATNSGSIINSSVIFYENINVATFAGFAYTSTGTMDMIALRQSKWTNISLAQGNFAIAHTSSAIAYAINATTLDLSSTTITNLYNAVEELAILRNYTEGYLDYYFTKRGKMTTTSGSSQLLHNVYDPNNADNTNTTYYYNYTSAGSDTYKVAIEVLAPLNRFIWEAFDANYLTYGTNLNRAVGLFALGALPVEDKTDAASQAITGYTAITSYAGEYVTIYNPAIGIIASAVIGGADMIQEYEYTGQDIEAIFEVTSEDPQNPGTNITQFLRISGKDVGTYTEYFEETASGGTSVGQLSGFDTTNRLAKILSSESSQGSAKIMLIIIPKAKSFTATAEKQYDATSIAEVYLSSKENSIKDIYAIGTYKKTNTQTSQDEEVSNVGNNYKVYINSYTKPVATFNGKYLSYYLSGVDAVTGRKIYTVQYINIGGNNVLQTNTQIKDVDHGTLARAYSQLVSKEEIQALDGIITFTDPNLTSTSQIVTSYVYDLVFEHSVDDSSKVSYNNSSNIYLAGTLFKIPTQQNSNSKTVYKNYKWDIGVLLPISTNTTLDAQESFVAEKMVNNFGRITSRTISATYTNLNQSYREKLQPFGVKANQVEDIDNRTLPYSFTEQDKINLINAMNTQINSGLSFNGNNVLSALAADINSPIEYVENDGYYVKEANKKYAEIELPIVNTNNASTGNFVVNIEDTAILTLRYFKYNSNKQKYMIETFEDLLMIDHKYGNDSYENDYDTLDYYVANNINAKSKITYGISREFKGTIDGENKQIKSFILVGTSNVGLFSSIAHSGSISNLSFINVLILPLSNATISIVALDNNGEVNNIEIEAQIATELNQEITINPVSVQTTKEVVIEGVSQNKTGVSTSNKVFIQTPYRGENKATINAMDATSESVLMLRYYSNKTASSQIAQIIHNTQVVQSFTSEAIRAVALKGINANTLALEINAENKAVINNFRQYWVYINICPWLDALYQNAQNQFLGYKFYR